jgi:hypothetical protein
MDLADAELMLDDEVPKKKEPENKGRLTRVLCGS